MVNQQKKSFLLVAFDKVTHLSPFLFILCVESLYALLRDAENKKEIHGVKIGKKVESISHLFFVDNNLLFIKANDEEVENILDIFSIYEALQVKN